MHPLAERVRRTLRHHQQAPPGSRVLVALSGGADSVALLHLLGDLEPSCGFLVAGAAHLNHQLRGEAADLDERFCRDLAAALGLPIVVERIDVGVLAASRHESIEEAGRAARYAFLARAAGELDADRIAVGHTRDDQAETFLLRLLRGAGPRGFSGVRPRFGSVVRPLFDVTHAEIRRYLSDRGVAFREDATNADITLARNRVRHELIPLLESRFAPGLVEILSREASIARDDAEYLEQAAEAAASGVVVDGPHGAEMGVAALVALPPALARRVVLGALERAAAGRFVGFEHVERVLELAGGRGRRGRVDLPGLRAERRDGRIQLVRSEGRATLPDAGTNSFRYSLSIPGEVVIAEAGCVIVAGTLARSSDHLGSGWLPGPGAAVAAVDAALLSTTLVVRNRKPGDRLRPLGMSGTKKLQDLFVDRKVAAERRNGVPIVVDGDDRIVWVPGLALADPFKVTSETKCMVILKLKDLGVPA